MNRITMALCIATITVGGLSASETALPLRSIPTSQVNTPHHHQMRLVSLAVKLQECQSLNGNSNECTQLLDMYTKEHTQLLYTMRNISDTKENNQ